MVRLRADAVGKVFHTRDSGRFEAIRDITLTVANGELLSLVGPSGCGKTTLLRCLSGLDGPTTGSVTLDAVPVLEPVSSMAIVFQEYGRSLYPWLTVMGNVVLPLRDTPLSKPERERRSREALDDVGLTGFADRHPWQLSGGMQQRVAIARALAYRPTILLMDEPFASVDAQTREDLEDLLLRVRAHYDMAIVFVTHDIEESVYLGDRVMVLTAPPTTVKESFRVELPGPRSQLETKSLPEFADLRRQVYRSLRRDAESSPERDPHRSQSEQQKSAHRAPPASDARTQTIG